MKRYSILFLLLTLCSTITFAQKEQFEKDVQEFIKLSNDSDWKAVTEMMHPSMFTTFSKEQMADMMNQMNVMGLQTQIDFKSITNVDAVIKNSGKSYQKFNYDAKVTVKMTDQLWANKDFLLNGFKKSFGAESLNIDEANKRITMEGVQSMIAVKDAGATSWKYLSFQGAGDAMVKAAVPQEVFKKFVE